MGMISYVWKAKLRQRVYLSSKRKEIVVPVKSRFLKIWIVDNMYDVNLCMYNASLTSSVMQPFRRYRLRREKNKRN